MPQETIAKRLRFKDSINHMVPLDAKNPMYEGLRMERCYDLVANAAHKHLEDTAMVKDIPWSERDVEAMKTFLLEVAEYAHPNLFSNFPEHLMLASIYAEKLARRLNNPAINPLEARTLALFHDIGTIIDAPDYARKDAIGHRLAARGDVQIREDVLAKLPNILGILGMSNNSVESLADVPIAQRVLDMENLGKRNPDGTLFSQEQMKAYTLAQPKRYEIKSPYPSTRKGLQALNEGRQQFATHLVVEEIEWFEKQGINFDALREEIWEEFQRPENQQWILAFQDRQQTLNRNTDEALGRPAIHTIVFDIGNVLVNAPDEILTEKIATEFSCSQEDILAFLTQYATQAMSGKMGEKEFLRLFYENRGKPLSDNIEEARRPFIHPEIYESVEGMQELLRDLSANHRIQIRFLSDVIPSVKDVVLAKLHQYYPEVDTASALFSCDIGASKREQNALAFQKLDEHLGNPDPETVLFIDDNSKYVDIASVRYKHRKFHFRPSAYGKSPAQRLREELKGATIL